MDSADVIVTLASMTEVQKKYCAAYLRVIMAADGNIDDSEIKLCAIVSALCGFPNMTIKEALDFWAAN